jgi:glycosyltransferase involved in cell wall biosynthesis
MITGLGYAFVSDDKKAIFVRWVVKVLYWLSLRLNEKVFFQNEDDRALFVSLGLLPSPEHAVVVPGSGVDLEKFSLAQLPDAHNFLLIARLLRDKGIREYANAAAIVKKKYPDCSFLLVGGGDVGNPAAISKQDLDRWIHEGTLEYLGFMEDVRLAIARCKVYVLPSYREGTPRTVLEAMAMGRPIITTNVPGCREPVQDNYNGFLVPARNSVHLATAMLRMIEIPELAAIMGKRSRHIVEQRYDARVVACKMLDEMKL